MNFESLEELMEYMGDVNPNAKYPTGFEASIVGVVEVDGETLFLIDRGKCIALLEEGGEMTYEEAEEFFEYNIAGSKGDGMPGYSILLNEKDE